MKLITKTRVRRALIPLAALAVAAAIVPTAGAADCAMKPGANCAGMDLRGHDMNGMDLHGMNLAGANMTGMKISGANMTGVNLKGAKMSGMTLTNMTMSKANMAGTDLSTTKIHGGTWKGAKFISSNFRKIRIIGGDFQGANFTRVSNGAQGNLAPRSWQGATNNYQNGVQGGSYVNGANFSNATFNYVNLCSTTFNNAKWQNAKILSSAICGSTFTGNNTYWETVVVMGSDFWHNTFSGTMWASQYVVNTAFSGATCSGLQSGHTLWGSVYGSGNDNTDDDVHGTCSVSNND